MERGFDLIYNAIRYQEGQKISERLNEITKLKQENAIFHNIIVELLLMGEDEATWITQDGTVRLVDWLEETYGITKDSPPRWP